MPRKTLIETEGFKLIQVESGNIEVYFEGEFMGTILHKNFRAVAQEFINAATAPDGEEVEINLAKYYVTS